MNITLMLITAVSEESECCQGRVAVIQCVMDVFRVCPQSSSRTPNSYRRDCFLQFVRREESNPSSMNDSKESLFVSNVVGAISAIPSCPSLHLPFRFPHALPSPTLPEPRCTRSSLPENTYFLLGGGGWNVRLDSRAGISTTQKFYYFAIHFICFVWRIHAGRPIIPFRLLLYAYWRFGARVAASFLTLLVFHWSLHEDAVTISPKLDSVPEGGPGMSVSIPGRKELVSS